MKTRFFRLLLTSIAIIILCITCNAAAFLIDTPEMRKNTQQGVALLGDQGASVQLVGGFKSSQLDGYTDVLILKTAGYVGKEDLLRKTFGGYRVDLPNDTNSDLWKTYCTYDATGEQGGFCYARYWHGYTLPLRFLLCFFNLSNIEMLLNFLQTALFVLVLILLVQRKLYALLPGFFLSYFLMMPSALGICIQFAPVSLLMLSSCALLLLAAHPIDQFFSFPGYFLIIGILTNYFDLLTFPLITLGYPLILLLGMRIQSGKDCNLKELGFEFLFCSTAWGIGFAGMWGLKWAFTAAIFGADKLQIILSQIFLRVSTESNGDSYTRLSTLQTNLGIILSKASYLALILFAGLCSIGNAVFSFIKGKRLDLQILIFLPVALIPFVWCLIMNNHCYDHAFYTYRIFTVSVFACFSALFLLFSRNGNAKQ